MKHDQIQMDTSDPAICPIFRIYLIFFSRILEPNKDHSDIDISISYTYQKFNFEYSDSDTVGY